MPSAETTSGSNHPYKESTVLAANAKPPDRPDSNPYAESNSREAHYHSIPKANHRQRHPQNDQTAFGLPSELTNIEIFQDGTKAPRQKAWPKDEPDHRALSYAANNQLIDLNSSGKAIRMKTGEAVLRLD